VPTPRSGRNTLVGLGFLRLSGLFFPAMCARAREGLVMTARAPLESYDRAIKSAEASKEASLGEDAAELAAGVAYVTVLWCYEHRNGFISAANVCACAFFLALALLAAGVL